MEHPEETKHHLLAMLALQRDIPRGERAEQEEARRKLAGNKSVKKVRVFSLLATENLAKPHTEKEFQSKATADAAQQQILFFNNVRP